MQVRATHEPMSQNIQIVVLMMAQFPPREMSLGNNDLHGYKNK